MSPKTKEKWIELGLEILGKEGVSAITIDHMTNVLGVTKGSFYHHFQNIQSFRTALLIAWEKDTVDIIHTIETSKAPGSVLRALLGEFQKRSPGPEIAIRAWAVTDPLPREHMTRLDTLRCQFLSTVMGRVMPASVAKTAADLLYSIIVGSLSMHPPFGVDRISRLFQEIFRIYGISPDPMEKEERS